MAQGSAINDILQMRQQGLSNNQVIQNLQRQGYTNTQIFDAMNQADTKMAVEGMQQGAFPTQPMQNSAAAQDVFTQPPAEANLPTNEPYSQEPMAAGQDTGGAIQYADDQVKVEELVEAIIEEKWAELVKDINKIIDWKAKIENRVSELEIKVGSLKDGLSDLNKAVLGRINEYDKHIIEIGSDIQAMEKVFSKVLPKFTENVNELSRIANKMDNK